MAEILREQRTFGNAELFADTRKRSNAVNDRSGNGTVETVFHREIEAAVPASDDKSTLRADWRHRKRRADCAASYGVHDAWEFLIRGLFQGRGNSMGVGILNGGLRTTTRKIMGIDISERQRGGTNLVKATGIESCAHNTA